MAEINITPFTDVLLVLLIIFMILAALVVPPGFEKQLANPGGNPPKTRRAKNIEVQVTSRAVIFVDGQKTDASGVYGVMAMEHSRLGNRHVRIIGDVKTPYGAIIRVLDACKAAGLDDVEFISG